jgi:hypothetical protein
MNVTANQVCLAGLVRRVDPGPLAHPIVTLAYRSVGGIKRVNAKRLIGDFVDVDLTLTIEENGTDLFPPTTITSACELRGRLLRSGERDKVVLRCEAGENLSAFGSLDGLLENVEGAFPRRGAKHIRINTETGRIRIVHNGQPVPTNQVQVSCDFPE